MHKCNICGILFSASSNLSRHRKSICLPKQEREQENITILIDNFKILESRYISEINILKNDYAELKKEHAVALNKIDFLTNTIDDLMPFKTNYIALLEKSHESTTKVIEMTTETTKINAETNAKSLSTVKYISKHLNKAQPLKYKKDEIVGLLEYNVSKKYKPTDYMIYHHSIKKLDKWIGDIIIQIYKKENPFEQSVWATDSSRYSYLICEVIDGVNGKRNEWITDKSGTKITQIIINPTLELMSEMLRTYLDETIDYDVNKMNIDEVMKVTGNRNIANEILKEILDNKLHKEVLKYITPFLSADLSLLKQQENTMNISETCSEDTHSLSKSKKKKLIVNILENNNINKLKKKK
jgi:hypothetical protein